MVKIQIVMQKRLKYFIGMMCTVHQDAGKIVPHIWDTSVPDMGKLLPKPSGVAVARLTL